MQRLITSYLRIIASELKEKSESEDLSKKLKDEYGVTVLPGNKPENIKKLYESLKKLPAQLVRDCKIDTMDFKDLGPSKKFYPNHGSYKKGVLTINEQILSDPVMEVDPPVRK